MANVKLAEALLRRKELSDKVKVLANIKANALFEVKAQRRNVTESLDDIVAQTPRGLIIRSAKDSFIAGADIQEFANFKSAEDARKAVNEVLAKNVERERQAADERQKNEAEQRKIQQIEQEANHKMISELENRYRKALAEDSNCAKQDQELVACPLE